MLSIRTNQIADKINDTIQTRIKQYYKDIETFNKLLATIKANNIELLKIIENTSPILFNHDDNSFKEVLENIHHLVNNSITHHIKKKTFENSINYFLTLFSDDILLSAFKADFKQWFHDTVIHLILQNKNKTIRSEEIHEVLKLLESSLTLSFLETDIKLPHLIQIIDQLKIQLSSPIHTKLDLIHALTPWYYSVIEKTIRMNIGTHVSSEAINTSISLLYNNFFPKLQALEFTDQLDIPILMRIVDQLERRLIKSTSLTDNNLTHELTAILISCAISAIKLAYDIKAFNIDYVELFKSNIDELKTQEPFKNLPEKKRFKLSEYKLKLEQTLNDAQQLIVIYLDETSDDLRLNLLEHNVTTSETDLERENAIAELRKYQSDVLKLKDFPPLLVDALFNVEHISNSIDILSGLITRASLLNEDALLLNKIEINHLTILDHKIDLPVQPLNRIGQLLKYIPNDKHKLILSVFQENKVLSYFFQPKQFIEKLPNIEQIPKKRKYQ